VNAITDLKDNIIVIDLMQAHRMNHDMNSKQIMLPNSSEMPFVPLNMLQCQHFHQW